MQIAFIYRAVGSNLALPISTDLYLGVSAADWTSLCHYSVVF